MSQLKVHLSRIRAYLADDGTGGLLRGILILGLGSGLGRSAAILSVPILTRLYTPEDFGALAAFIAFTSILAPVVTLRYVLALPLPIHDAVAMSILVVSATLMTFLTGIVTLLLWIFGDQIIDLIGVSALAPWWWLVPVGIFGTATYELLTMWATRQRAYSIMARTAATQSIFGSIVKVGLGLLGMQTLGLLVGQIVAQSSGSLRLLRKYSRDLKEASEKVTWSIMRQVAWRHRKFAFWRVPSQLIMTISAQGPLLIVAALYEPATAGQLALAITVISLPTSLIAQNASQAFYAEAAKLGPSRNHRIRNIYTTLTTRLAGFSLIISLPLLLFGKSIFPLMFGDDWVLAGTFAQALGFCLIFQFMQAPAVHVFHILDFHTKLFLQNVFRLIFISAAFIVSYFMSMGPAETIWVYSISLSLHYAIKSIVAHRLFPKSACQMRGE